MFSGIIETVARVAKLEIRNLPTGQAEALLAISTGYSDLVLGESIAVNGACLTVAETTPEGLAQFYASEETLKLTNLSDLRIGGYVNLERALRANARLSGHIVQGHVDGVGSLAVVEPTQSAYFLKFAIPESLARYCVLKGSITIDGISLTLNQVTERQIEVMIIPHTWEQTRLSKMKPGDRVNVEVDVLAKYVERLCQPYLRA